VPRRRFLPDQAARAARRSHGSVAGIG